MLRAALKAMQDKPEMMEEKPEITVDSQMAEDAQTLKSAINDMQEKPEMKEEKPEVPQEKPTVVKKAVEPAAMPAGFGGTAMQEPVPLKAPVFPTTSFAQRPKKNKNKNKKKKRKQSKE
jgi:hypothetical protein